MGRIIIYTLLFALIAHPWWRVAMASRDELAPRVKHAAMMTVALAALVWLALMLNHFGVHPDPDSTLSLF